MNSNKISDTTWLDGVRGGAALWVFITHIHILSGGYYLPVISWGTLAVDLFILISGFLMTHHYFERSHKEPWGKPTTWLQFWIRRYFRIAPLYYLLIVVAITFSALYASERLAIANTWPHAIHASARFSETSVANYLSHISFLFILEPTNKWANAIPDWSIALEMQFYLVFPLLALLMRHAGPFRTGLFILLATRITEQYCAEWLSTTGMPTLLFSALDMLIIGMWISWGRSYGKLRSALIYVACISLSLLLIKGLSTLSVSKCFIIMVLFYFLDDGSLTISARLRNLIARCKQILSSRIARFMGQTSYGVYLLHMLILYPVAGELTHFAWYVDMPAPVRALICGCITLPLVYLLAAILYRRVERPSNAFGPFVLFKIFRPNLQKTFP